MWHGITMGLVLLVAPLLASASRADRLTDACADTSRRIALVEAICTLTGEHFEPSHFRLLRVLRGDAPDSFTAIGEPRDEFAHRLERAGGSLLIALAPGGWANEYEVIRAFRDKCAPPQFVAVLQDRVHSGPPRAEAIAEAESIWDAGGREAAPPVKASIRTTSRPWNAADRDSLLRLLESAMRYAVRLRPIGPPSGERGTSMSFVLDGLGTPGVWADLAHVLWKHPDSLTRRFAMALWDSARTPIARNIALTLLVSDETAEAHHWFSSLSPTGFALLDQQLAYRAERDTTPEGRGLLRQLALQSRPGDMVESYAFPPLQRDTSEAIRAERWRHIAEYRPPGGDRVSESWRWGGIADNWFLGQAWSRAEAWRAFSDTSMRMRVVGTRVLCGRNDSAAVAQVMLRIRKGKGPQGQRLSPDEIVDAVSALPTRKRTAALRLVCEVSRRRDPIGTAALNALVRDEQPGAWKTLRARAWKANPRDSSWGTVWVADFFVRRARRMAARGAVEEADLKLLHRMALHAHWNAASGVFHVIAQVEGVAEMVSWARRRYQGFPPDREWDYLTFCERSVGEERKWRALEARTKALH